MPPAGALGLRDGGAPSAGRGPCVVALWDTSRPPTTPPHATRNLDGAPMLRRSLTVHQSRHAAQNRA